MKDTVNRFYNSIEDVDKIGHSLLISLFVYFHTVKLGKRFAQANDIIAYYDACDLAVPTRVGARLYEGLRSKPQKYLKSSIGYKLERHYREFLETILSDDPSSKKVNATLRSLEQKLAEGEEKRFLAETIDCFEVGANRACIVMVWILTLDHIISHVINHKMNDFNQALSNDRGVKLDCVRDRDDFSDIREAKLIELCRAAKIISNDVRKILDNALGVRNSAAHPSGVKVADSKVIAVVEDLVENVILKYPT